MDGRQVRHLASGALLAGSLVSGGTVGNVLLLGSAEHRGDPVGRLSAHLGNQLPAPTARGAGAAAQLVIPARGSRAMALKPARVTIARTSGTAATQPVVITAPATRAPATTKHAPTVVNKPVPRTQPTASKGARAATTNPVVTTQPTVATGPNDRVAKPAVTQPPETHPEDYHPAEPIEYHPPDD
jgi:hypothetical protein